MLSAAFILMLSTGIGLAEEVAITKTDDADLREGETQGLQNGEGATTAWKEEFQRICSNTDIAISLSPEQLAQLIKDSEGLLGRLREVQDPWAKVYIFRLENCRKFFGFALEVKKNEESP